MRERATECNGIEFEWDEAKRLSNLVKHGFDFGDADLLFGGPILHSLARSVDGEVREQAIGMLDGLYVTAVYTMRGQVVRLISMRRARDGERREYSAVFRS